MGLELELWVDNHEAMEVHPGTIEAHPGAMKAHLGAMRLTLEPLRLIPDPLKSTCGHKDSPWSHGGSL